MNTKYKTKRALTLAIRAALLGLPVTALSLTTVSTYAATATINTIAIPTNSLDQALKQLAIQTGTTISYDAKALSKFKSAGLNGRYSTEQAITLLLQPHQLSAVKLTNGGYSIKINENTTSADPSSTDAIQLPVIVVTATANNPLTTEESGLYTAKATTAATGLALSLRETPQLVSVMTSQQMKDQNLTQLTDVAAHTAGLTVNQGGNIGSDNSPIYSRGKSVDNYLLDGVKLLNEYSSIFQSQDTALFDRVEITRGANGLMTGAGTASASINLVRKKPLQDFKASISADAGSWDTYRTDLDISAPLNQSGTIRGRTLFAYQDGDSYIDRYSEERKVAYGVIEADLTNQTKVSLGVSYQNIDVSGVARGGLPSFYTDGSRINWSRSDSAAASWTYSDRSTTSYFTDVEHKFNDVWTLKGMLSRTITSSDEVVGYTYSSGGIDRNTGKGAMLYATRWDYEPKQNLFNLTLNGSFDLFNQTHDLVIGTTYTNSRNQRPSYSSWNNDMTWNGNLDNIFAWDGDTPARPSTLISGWYGSNDRSQSIFGALRLKPSDNAAVILGARVEDWKRVTKSHNVNTNITTTIPLKESGKVIPYIGLTYDFLDHWTAYASYTNIFSPQDNKTVTGEYLDPLVGDSTELGIKGEFFDNQLNIGAAIYQTKEDNFPVSIPGVSAPDGSQAYRGESGTKSRGFELEATGKLTDTWQISTSFSRNLSEDNKGIALNTNIPNNTAKLFTTYTLPYFNEALTVGGGLRWQSEIFSTNGPQGTRFTQDSYTLADLMARYKVSDKLQFNLNVHNLFNEKYNQATTNSYYGAPINFKAGVKYEW